MTIYVFDSGPLRNLFRYYYPKRFPSLWEQFHQMVEDLRITSTRDVFNELVGHGDNLANWCKKNRWLFEIPSAEELKIVQNIFRIRHFQMMIRKKELMQGKPVADPFVIARAACLEGCVVTTEHNKPNSANIPNVCEHFGIDCCNLEEFMEREDWCF